MLGISQHVSLSGHDDVALFERHCEWRWINMKIVNYAMIASLKSEPTCKLITRIPGSCLLISSIPGSASFPIQQAFSKPCLVNMISKDTESHLVFSIYKAQKVYFTLQRATTLRFPTKWYVQLAKVQISLRICAVWSEPLLVAWIFYDS